MVKILMVCLGNICRSPLAEGILNRELENRGIACKVDSAGTSSWHEGESPDSRSVAVAKKNGIDISMQRARPFRKNDLDQFDLIFAMDHSNYDDILQAGGRDFPEKVHILLEYADYKGDAIVPDPYYGGKDGFDKVFDLLESNSTKICDRIEREILK